MVDERHHKLLVVIDPKDVRRKTVTLDSLVSENIAHQRISYVTWMAQRLRDVRSRPDIQKVPS